MPFPLSGGDKPASKMVSHKEFYPTLLVAEIPTIIDEGVVLSNHTDHIRYGYFIGRPVDRMFRGPVANFLKHTFLAKAMAHIPPLLHWGILISDEPPLEYSVTGTLPHAGSMVPRPDFGTIFELRNSVTTGLVSLDVKNWTSYPYRQDKVKFLGPLNKTDYELITIGRAYIKQVGKEGFHNFYRNCQHFTAWYIQSLWPKVGSTTRADQLLGKLLWWFRDWRRTARWGADKVKWWTGFKVSKTEEVDSSAEFVELEELLRQDSRAGHSDVKNEPAES
jgi:hypothetical protein